MSELSSYKVRRSGKPDDLIVAVGWEISSSGCLRFVNKEGNCIVMYNTNSWDSVVGVARLIPWK